MRRMTIALFITCICLLVLLLQLGLPENTSWPIYEEVVVGARVETGSPNAVTAIYLFYRYYDTLFEALMLLFAILGIQYLSVHGKGGRRE